jgi:hypothetical protein
MIVKSALNGGRSKWALLGRRYGHCLEQVAAPLNSVSLYHDTLPLNRWTFRQLQSKQQVLFVWLSKASINPADCEARREDKAMQRRMSVLRFSRTAGREPGAR